MTSSVSKIIRFIQYLLYKIISTNHIQTLYFHSLEESMLKELRTGMVSTINELLKYLRIKIRQKQYCFLK